MTKSRREHVGRDAAAATALIESTKSAFTERVADAATPASVDEQFVAEIGHQLYAGDTALHVAAAAFDVEVVALLLASGADISARNRRRAEPLHYAVDGGPGSRVWNEERQIAVIRLLLDAGANLEAVAAGGVTPLHRAVRNRCAGAVRALILAGASCTRTNANGSTALQLARQNTGRGGTGSAEAKRAQTEIIELLEDQMTSSQRPHKFARIPPT